jgi:hypothetical protein
MPIGNYNASLGVPRTKGLHGGRQFTEVVPIFEQGNFSISGITKDSTGVALGNCIVYVFRSDMQQNLQITSEIPGRLPIQAPSYVWTGVSDGSGNFSAGPFAGNSGNYWLAAWGPTGTVAGITLNTVVPS